MADDKLVPGTQLLKPEYAGTAIDPTSQFVPKSLVEVAGIDWLTFTSANWDTDTGGEFTEEKVFDTVKYVYDNIKGKELHKSATGR